MLVALLIVVGAVVACILVLWYTSRFFVRPRPVPVSVESWGGRGMAAPGFARDLAPVQEDELPDQMFPEVSTALELVSGLAKDASRMDAPNPELLTGQQKSQGDSRRAGPEGEGLGNTLPRHLRWEIRFGAGHTPETYLQQLDFFGIELGVLADDGNVRYVAQLANPQADTREGPRDAERRLFMLWKSGQLADIDRAVLQRAGVEAEGRLILHFIPPEVEIELARLERVHANDKPVDSIRKTVYGIQPEGAGFAFYVARQYYR